MAETENLSSGGTFQFYKNELLIPLNTNVESSCYHVYGLKNNKFHMKRSGKLFGLEGGEPIGGFVNDEMTVVCYGTHSNFYTHDLVCQND